MKKLMLSAIVALSFACGSSLLADAVTVKATIEATANNSRAKNECLARGKKLAVEKYVSSLDKHMQESLISKAANEYAKFVDEVETTDSAFEDGELTCEYSITVKREAVMAWLSANGWNAATGNPAANAIKVRVVVAEEAPDAGARQLAKESGTDSNGAGFFYIQYTEFQKGIRDALVAQMDKLGISTVLLEDDPAYAEYKDADPAVVGYSYDPSIKDFKETKGFLETIRDNNPDCLVLYYRIGGLAFDTETKKAHVSISLNFKNLQSGATKSLGKPLMCVSPTMTSNSPIVRIQEMVQTVTRSINALFNGADGGAKVIASAREILTAAAAPKGPMVVVFNCSKVDKKYRDDVLVEIEDGMQEAKLCGEKDIRSVGNTVTCTITSADSKMKDQRRLWMKIKKVLAKTSLPEELVNDGIKTVSGNTMTVKPDPSAADGE